MTRMSAFISMPGTAEWLVIALVGLLIFGRRLPEVARSLGQTIVSFKKGLREAERELETPRVSDRPPSGFESGPPPAQLPPGDSRQGTDSSPPHG